MVALLGEALRGERHELVPPVLAPLRQSPGHGGTVRSLDRTVKNTGRPTVLPHRAPGVTPRSHALRTVPGMETYVVRMWLPDRPGALGQVASRIGAVRGEIVGIDILERGAGRAIDELVVELPDGALDRPAGARGPAGRRCRRRGGAAGGRRAARSTPRCPRDGGHPRGRQRPRRARRGARRARPSGDRRRVGRGRRPRGRRGDGRRRGRSRRPRGCWRSWTAARRRPAWPRGETGADDVVWSPLPSTGLALVLGRGGTAYRARERRQVAALARIVDTRLQEIARARARFNHPSLG